MIAWKLFYESINPPPSKSLALFSAGIRYPSTGILGVYIVLL